MFMGGERYELGSPAPQTLVRSPSGTLMQSVCCGRPGSSQTRWNSLLQRLKPSQLVLTDSCPPFLDWSGSEKVPGWFPHTCSLATVMEFIYSEVFMEKFSGWLYRNVLLLLPLFFSIYWSGHPFVCTWIYTDWRDWFYLFNAKSPSSPANAVKLFT